MAQMVTIEGSMTPSSDLPRGQRRDVVLTDRIERLVAKGFVVIVGESWDSDEPETELAPIPEANQAPPAPGPHIFEGTGEPNVGYEAPADGSWATFTPNIPADVPQAPDETAQPDPKVPTVSESGTGG